MLYFACVLFSLTFSIQISIQIKNYVSTTHKLACFASTTHILCNCSDWIETYLCIVPFTIQKIWSWCIFRSNWWEISNSIKIIFSHSELKRSNDFDRKTKLTSKQNIPYFICIVRKYRRKTTYFKGILTKGTTHWKIQNLSVFVDSYFHIERLNSPADWIL